ncbi:patatin-like phospholipase family protein [Tropicimonas sp. IMCC34043]|uniref:patatin-like phospholipase family protein n=1 Tax=Tropicimonas sp. IMCC34043 TaxID=2248760 RepID=UPI000E28857D|nr:patatin-like phospholipase family protein [Tropicimonas sp. IMCC34043]
MGVKRINLALQGGGAHGAFTWGVLDRLLEDEDIEIAGISGTSAGALNAAALKAGLVAEGQDHNRAMARANLDWLWQQVAGVQDLRLTSWFAPFAPPTQVYVEMLDKSPAMLMADAASLVVSPYSYGPFYRNPLERIVSAFAFDRVCAHRGPALYISATNVRTGKIRVFGGAEISTDVILASGCLPSVFQAIEFEDPATGQVEAFWDGGYTGNPAIFPLFCEGLPPDVVIININPLFRPDVPKLAAEINNRVNEISFNSSLLSELRAIQFVRELIADGRIGRGEMRDVLVHMIADDELMRELSVSTKMVPSPVILTRLKAAGRAAADGFLQAHKDDLNQRGSVDLKALFG